MDVIRLVLDITERKTGASTARSAAVLSHPKLGVVAEGFGWSAAEAVTECLAEARDTIGDAIELAA